MKDPREEPWTYHVKFSVGTAHYKEMVQAYGKDMVKKKLQMQYPNCKVVVRDEDIVREEKKYKAPTAEDADNA